MDHVRVPENSYILEYPWNLVSGKMQRPFLKKISQSKSDKPSCRCKNGGGEGGGVCTQARINFQSQQELALIGPPSPWIRHY